MDLSIIVVNWNTRDLLAQCLDSIYANSPDCEFEVWVVDNASSDGSAQMVRERFNQIRLIENPENIGFACANNMAICRSSAEMMLLLNSDAAVLSGTLTTMVRWMEDHPTVGILGATLLNPDGTFQASFGDFPNLFSQLLTLAGLARRVCGPYFPSHGPSNSTVAVRADWVGGACLMARRISVASIGLLDGAFFMYVEELDWCYRMWRSGWEVYSLPTACCLHWGGQSSWQVSHHTLARLATSVNLFFRKHYPSWTGILFRAGVVLIGLGKAAIYAAQSVVLRPDGTEWRNKIRANLNLATAGLRG